MTNVAAEQTENFIPALTALDRCDSCGAQAYVRAVMPTGELLFCAHHASEYKEKLTPIVTAWHDETHRLFDEASTSSAAV